MCVLAHSRTCIQIHASGGGISPTKTWKLRQTGVWQPRRSPSEAERLNLWQEKCTRVTTERILLPKESRPEETYHNSSFYYRVSHRTIIQLTNQIVRIALPFIKGEHVAMMMCKCINGHDPNRND